MKKYFECAEKVEKEYICPHFIEESGLSKDELVKGLEEIYNTYIKTESMMLVRARMIKFILANAQIQIDPYNPFADRINEGTTYNAYADWDGVGEILLRNTMRPRVLEKHIPELFEKRNIAYSIGCMTADADYWHTVPCWHDILSLGFVGLLERAKQAREKNDLTKEQYDFYDSVIITYEAIIDYIKRLYEISKNYDISEYTNALKNIASKKPETLYEALLTVYLYTTIEEIGCERARCLGRIDIHYYPFYVNDLKTGKSEEDIKELFRFFFGKFHAARRYANQPLDLCGVDVYGIKGENELTWLILDVWNELGFDNPKVHIHCHNGMDEKIIPYCMNLIRDGKNSIVFVNDETVFKAYDKIGISQEESRLYEVLGCYEPIIPGVEEPCIGGSWLNMAKAMEFLFTGGKDKITGYQFSVSTPDTFETFEDFYNGYLTQLDYLVDFAKSYIEINSSYNMQINPSPVYSASSSYCIEKGKDIFNKGAKYTNTSVKCFGIGTVVDSIYAVKKYVFDEKRISFSEMRKAVLSNWNGYEALRIEISRDKEKYGCGNEKVDNIAKAIYKHLSKSLTGRRNGREGVWRMGGDSIDYSLSFGAKVAATPDGRFDKEALSKNLCATLGKDINGITALIRSATTIDHTDFCDGIVLDFLLHPSAVSGEDGLAAMCGLLKVYFARGGLALQGNVFSTEDLIDAQKNPGKYPSLQVRVCGWNEYFDRMSKEMQDFFIAQLKSE